MYMSVVDRHPSTTIYPELAGRRVLVTGLTPHNGVDVARAFADHGCRLVLQSTGDSPEVVAIGELLSQSAGDVRMFTTPLADGEAAVRFAQTAVQAFGGLEVVVNLVDIGADGLAHCNSMYEVEDRVSASLLPMTLMTRVFANRMRLTETEGLLLNVILMPKPTRPAEAAVAGIVRSAVAALTRGEAHAWAGEALRINAIAPPSGVDGGREGAGLVSEADIAALALHLASKRGRRLSGLVFDASGAATRCC